MTCIQCEGKWARCAYDRMRHKYATHDFLYIPSTPTHTRTLCCAWDFHFEIYYTYKMYVVMRLPCIPLLFRTPYSFSEYCIWKIYYCSIRVVLLDSTVWEGKRQKLSIEFAGNDFSQKRVRVWGERNRRRGVEAKLLKITMVCACVCCGDGWKATKYVCYAPVYSFFGAYRFLIS